MVIVIDDFWKRVVDEAGVDVFFRGDTQLIPRAEAARFAEWAARERKILGIEGFLFDGQSVTPLMECIADFSGLPKGDSGLEDALDVIKQPDFQKPHFFEFVLQEKHSP